MVGGGCKTEKKTLPMPLVGFSKKRIHVAMKLHTAVEAREASAPSC